jgi:hypothetical protein
MPIPAAAYQEAMSVLNQEGYGVERLSLHTGGEILKVTW